MDKTAKDHSCGECRTSPQPLHGKTTSSGSMGDSGYPAGNSIIMIALAAQPLFSMTSTVVTVTIDVDVVYVSLSSQSGLEIESDDKADS